MNLGKKTIILTGLAFLLVLGSFASAQACALYNWTSYPVKFSLTCGTFCGNAWYVNPDQKTSYPGKGGSVEVLILDKKYAQGCVADKVYINVDDHGWVSVYERTGYFLIKSWRKGGSLKKEIKVDLYD